MRPCVSKANILVSYDHQAYICDFGLSEFIVDGVRVNSHSNQFLPGGNIRWQAPELCLNFDLNRRKVRMIHRTPATDIFAFGRLGIEVRIHDSNHPLDNHLLTGLWKLFTLEIPFSEYEDGLPLLLRLQKDIIPDRPPDATGLNDEMWHFLCRCWSSKPHRRPKANEACEILNHYLLSRQRCIQ